MTGVVTFGEIMLRLTPRDDRLILQAHSFNAHYGGSEYNVAAGLSALGNPSVFITRLPDNPVGHAALADIRKNGVAVHPDIFTPEGRLGIYYLEMGSSPRPNRVVYDRAGASIAVTDSTSYDWGKYLDGATWFHVSGITPAMGPAPYRATVDAINEASKAGIPVSFDINYRKKLWSEEDARKLLSPILEKCAVVISTEEDLERVFAIGGETPRQLAENAVNELGADTVAITLREMISVKRNMWGGCAYQSGIYVESRMYECEVVDRVGAGDSFTAGFISGLMDKDLQYAVNLAAAFSALKQTIPGDVCPVTRSQAEELMKSGSPGRIQR